MTYAPPATRRRSTGWLAVVLVVLLLAAAAVAVDRWFVTETERRVATELEPSIGARPDVSIGGFPFLTQYAAGELDDVRITADTVTYTDLTLTDVTFDAAGVPTDLTQPVGQVRVDAVVPADTLTAALQNAEGVPDGVTIVTQDGAVVASVSVLGLPIEATLAPRPDGRAIAVDVEEVTIGGAVVSVVDLPAFVADALTGLRVELDQLPEGLELTTCEVTDDGVRLVAEGTDVVLPTG
ncbi:conserved hypothetical protein [Beutenbergia cavernae DSM 12333]|uniref:DUF2993 domain-containing protein n=1 Tax=Beutenbergia cavernae (strain ATCC BAA-8 / DSM 12333 / CCUG 43141 / JCM 11478 / NBRC 16432 / NCIMB 13614 / HKI 0122) TaxID=471853 RepID=C5C547_BEUC1|nr:DUF2993 domain-containing protein [Beutenbergia cavernae]ACQ82187.1 conserved hypothetical protein [Beutenbergia cavernae DSM 12333]